MNQAKGPPAVVRVATLFALLGVLCTPFPISRAKSPAEPTRDETIDKRIRGRVTDAAGNPIPGATVRVLADGLWHDRQEVEPAAWSEPVVVATDEEGTFEAGGLVGDTFVVRAEVAGRTPAGEETIPAGAWLSLHLKNGRVARGVVLDAGSGRAVPRALVLACDPASFAFGREACARAETDDGGAFVLQGLPAGNIQFRAQAAGYAVSPVRTLALASAGDAPATTLRLRPGARVEGRVIDEQDRPVPSARVYVRPLAGSAHDLGRVELDWPAYTAPDGTFVLDGIPSGARFGIFAFRSDRGSAQGGALAVEDDADLDDVEIRLPSAARLAFRLLDENGDPVTGFELSHREGANDDESWVPVPASRTECEADGRCEVALTARGVLDLRLEPEGFAALQRESVQLDPGRTTDLGTLTAVRGLTLGGRVTDSEGRPVAGAVIEASWDDARGREIRGEVADTEGRFAIAGLDDRPVDLEAAAEGFVAELLQDVFPGRTDLELILRPSGGLGGRVEREDGEPPDGLLIVVHTEAETSLALEDPSEFPRKESFTTDDGSYEIRDLPPGRYTVEAWTAGHAPGRKKGVAVREGEIAEVPIIVLERGLELTGRVLTLEGEAPVAGATVEARRGGGTGIVSGSVQKRTGGSDTEGRFTIEGLEEGGYVVIARHAEFAPTEESVELTEGVRRDETVLRMSGGGTLVGTVRDAERAPAPGRRIQIARNLLDTADLDFATTDTEGRYERPRLAPGSYVVGLAPERGPGMRIDFKNAVIREGEITVVDFDETSRITLSGTVYRDGEPLRRAWLFFARTLSLTDVKFAATDAAGRYEVGLDEPGRYRVLLQSSSGSGGASAEIEVADRESVEQDIHLGVDGVMGTVTDDDGRPVAGAVVAATPLGASFAEQTAFLVAETGADGRYTIEGFRPGAYRVTATAPGFRVSATPVEVADGGGVQVVDFRLEPGATLRGRLLDETGHGIPGAPVLAGPAGTADGWGTGASTAVTDVNGAFLLTAPVDGPIDVTALPGGFAPARLTAVLPPEGDEELVLRAGPGGAVRVQVVGPDDSPRPGVQVTLGATPSYLGSDLVHLVTPIPVTDSAGAALLRYLAPGAYLVGVAGRSDASPASVVVQDGAESLIRIELP